MEQIVKSIFEKYISEVKDVCEILIQGINREEGIDIKDKREFFEYCQKSKRTYFCVEGMEFRLHGVGCRVTGMGKWLDWDFGYRSRWCGIEPWKISMYLKQNNSKLVEYYDENLLKKMCKQAIEDGIMLEKGGQYYFVIPEQETFQPDFPIEYDTLFIGYFDKNWFLPRSKLIDRFIRKSNRVYHKIGETTPPFTLKFLLNGDEVFSILYDDICYPENAVKIMSDIIIKQLLEGKRKN